MSKTRIELVNRALSELGVVGAGQTAAAEDFEVIDQAVPPVMGDLATRDIWVWGDPDAYDDDAFDHLAVLLANARARAFGAPPDEQKRLLAEARLRGLKPTILSGRTQEIEYF
jgi:hypothetical protein